MLKLTMKRPGKWERKRQEEEEAWGKKKKRKGGEKYGKKVWQIISKMITIRSPTPHALTM